MPPEPLLAPPLLHMVRTLRRRPQLRLACPIWSCLSQLLATPSVAGLSSSGARRFRSSTAAAEEGGLTVAPTLSAYLSSCRSAFSTSAQRSRGSTRSSIQGHKKTARRRLWRSGLDDPPPTHSALSRPSFSFRRLPKQLAKRLLELRQPLLRQQRGVKPHHDVRAIGTDDDRFAGNLQTAIKRSSALL